MIYSHRIHGAAIYGNIYHQYTPNVSICAIHGSYDLLIGFCLAKISDGNSIGYYNVAFATKNRD